MTSQGATRDPRVSPPPPAASPVAAALALLALPVAGLVPGGPFPTGPGPYLLLAAGVAGLAVLVFAARGRPADALALALALAPFVLFGWLERPRAVSVSNGTGEPRRAPVQGLRSGAPGPAAAAPPLARGPGPWLVATDASVLPDRGPVVLVLGASVEPSDEVDGATFVTADRASPHGDLVESALSAGNALGLDAFDAAFVWTGAWSPDDPGARARADALSTFVRRGGLLVGPAPGRPWPEPLGRRLGSAGQADTSGAASARRLGLGRVVRAASEAEVRDVLATGLWVPEVSTVFDRATGAPPTPHAFRPWRDEPSGRSRQALLLAVYALLLAVLDRVRPSGRGRLLAVLGPAAAVALGLVWSSPRDPGVRLEGVILDVGGPGARRVEAVWISAGPAGYRGFVRWQGGGSVRLLGGHLDADGRVVVPPLSSAWAVRETTARGVPDPGDEPDPDADPLDGLLRGKVDPPARRNGRGATLPVEVEGLPPPRVRSLLVRT